MSAMIALLASDAKRFLSADGKTYKEAFGNVEIVIQEWIETAKELGRPIPTPRGRLAFA